MASADLSAAVDRIETALASKLNLDLSEFDPQDVVNARRERVALAAAKARDLVDEAFAEPDLTVEQRVGRIEAALKSGGSLA